MATAIRIPDSSTADRDSALRLMGDSLGGPDRAEALRAGAKGRAPDFAPIGRPAGGPS